MTRGYLEQSFGGVVHGVVGAGVLDGPLCACHFAAGLSGSPEEHVAAVGAAALKQRSVGLERSNLGHTPFYERRNRMKVGDVMTPAPISISKHETVAVAARLLAHNNIGAAPVCDAAGRLCGMITDRDMVTRCLAAGKDPQKTAVAEVMTGGVVSVTPDMMLTQAATIMGSKQVRRLPVVENGKLCGIVSLADLAKNPGDYGRMAAILGCVSSNISTQ